MEIYTPDSVILLKGRRLGGELVQSVIFNWENECMASVLVFLLLFYFLNGINERYTDVER